MAADKDAFADVFAGNVSYANSFVDAGLSGVAGQGLAIITCIDSRINPLAVVGMKAGDVKIIRNAGAHVTDDVLRTLVLATYLLNVNRVLVMPHTDCRMANNSEAEIHANIMDRHGVDTRSMEFNTIDDQAKVLEIGLTRIESFPLLPDDLQVAGALYDVHTGRLEMFARESLRHFTSCSERSNDGNGQGEGDKTQRETNGYVVKIRNQHLDPDEYQNYCQPNL